MVRLSCIGADSNGENGLGTEQRMVNTDWGPSQMVRMDCGWANGEIMDRRKNSERDRRGNEMRHRMGTILIHRKKKQYGERRERRVK